MVEETVGHDPLRRPAGEAHRARRIAELLTVPLVMTLIAGAVYLLARIDEADTVSDVDGRPTPSQPLSVTDRFDRQDAAGLGVSTSGHGWTEVTGKWGVFDGHAGLVERTDEGPRSIAVVDTGSADITLRATAASMAPGWGLVFRYRTPFDYWYIAAVPQLAAYNVVLVTRSNDANVASTRTVARLPLAPTRDGVELGVRCRGSLIEIYVDGSLVHQLVNDALADATSVGLLAVDGARGGRWDDFTVTFSGDAGTETPSTASLP